MPVTRKPLPKAPTRRAYNSERRVRQATETRSEILRAAEDLFSARGYAAVSVDEIAARAKVAAATVYASGGKRELLDQLITHVVTAGTGGPVGVDPNGPALKDLVDPSAIIRLHVANIRALKERGARAHRVLWRAATSDAGAAKVWQRFTRVLLRGQRDLAERLADLGVLREELDVDSAADILQALVRPESFDALVIDRGWSMDRWEAYVVDAIQRLLLAGPAWGELVTPFIEERPGR